MATQMEDNVGKRRRGTFSQRSFLGAYLALAFLAVLVVVVLLSVVSMFAS